MSDYMLGLLTIPVLVVACFALLPDRPGVYRYTDGLRGGRIIRWPWWSPVRLCIYPGVSVSIRAGYSDAGLAGIALRYGDEAHVVAFAGRRAVRLDLRGGREARRYPDAVKVRWSRGRLTYLVREVQP